MRFIFNPVKVIENYQGQRLDNNSSRPLKGDSSLEQAGNILMDDFDYAREAVRDVFERQGKEPKLPWGFTEDGQALVVDVDESTAAGEKLDEALTQALTESQTPFRKRPLEDWF